jgi:hypothetical protein
MSETALAKDARGILNTAGPEGLRAAVMDLEPVTFPANSTKSQTLPYSPTETGDGAEKITFDPAETFYATETGGYYVNVGSHFRAYQRKTPVLSGIRRYLERNGHAQNDFKDLIADHMENIELDRAVDWVGGVAGYQRGILHHGGKRFLITDQPDMIEARSGDWPLLRSIIHQAFPGEDSKSVFLGWLKGGVDAIRKQTHHPAPMLVMAGPANAGKSLLAHVTKIAFGGRTANPMTAWTGKLVWNDNLLRSELLLIDDSLASTDPRARKALGSCFKESIYAGDVEINTRRKTSLSLRPVWRVMVCCNETPENLSVIPPLEDDIEDKIILLKISPVKTPMPAGTADEKNAFGAALREELPAFLGYLEKFIIPPHLTDSRSGITAWKDQELLDAVREISPEKRMENLISLCLQKGFFGIERGQSKWMAAAEVEVILKDRDSPTANQAQTLLNFHTVCGRNLSALAKHQSPFVAGTRGYQGTTQYLITRPGG